MGNGEGEGGAAEVSPNRCKECGAPFVPRRRWQVFCSPLCRMRAWARVHRPARHLK